MTFEFGASFGGGERPGDSNGSGIAFVGPGFGLGRKPGLVGDAAVERLADQDGKLDFGHIKPTAMLGGKVKLKLIFELMSTCCGQMLIK